MYNMSTVAKKVGIEYEIAWQRSRSKYAKERWGIVFILLPDGTKKPYVPEDKLYLWQKGKYLTRPSRAELEEYKNKN